MGNKKPNIIIVLADDMGYGDLSCYGSEKIQTPNMDAIADQGIKFSDAHSSSAVCTPSRYSLLTGRYCWRSSLKRGVLGGFGKPIITPDQTTLPSFLRGAGYKTAMFGKWHLGLEWRTSNGDILSDSSADGWNDGDAWNQPGIEVDFSQPIGGGPVDHGFDCWFGISGSLDMPPYCFIENRNTVGIPDREKTNYQPQQRKGMMTEDWQDDMADVTFTQKAVSYLHDYHESDSEDPFFLYIAPVAPHRPCVPPSFVEGKSQSGKRGDMVALVDWMVGELTQALIDTDQFENTLFIVTSDNGARLTNYDGKDYGHKSNGNLRGQKADIYEGGHREPLVMRWPSFITPGRENSELISLMDIIATSADILDIHLANDAAADSISFLPLLESPESAGLRESLIHHAYDGMFSIRRGEWKYIEGVGSGGFSEPNRYVPTEDQAKGQLYNIANDSRETLNLWWERQDIVQEMQQLLEQVRSSSL
ncbi:MAG: arylsulfatase [Bacteroidetes bacterium]|nr:arylsulfatase [Bacteroidota bacterium]